MKRFKLVLSRKSHDELNQIRKELGQEELPYDDEGIDALFG